MRQFLLLAACLVLPATAAHAASFDCTKATTAVEKAICNDPALSKADEELAEAYKAALGVALHPTAMAREQQKWIAARNKVTAIDELRSQYSSRLRELTESVEKSRTARRPISSQAARTTCVLSPDSMADDQCKVEEFGAVAGAPSLRYQLQSYLDDGHRMEGGVVVLGGPDAALTPMIVMSDVAAHYDAPKIVVSPAGRLLVLPGHLEGTGNLNAGAVYLYDDGRVNEVDSTSWLSDLQKRLPKGWGAWKGIYPDYLRFTARTPLWQEGDGNCCPTAGGADIRLRLQDRRLVLERLQITKGESAARQDQ